MSLKVGTDFCGVGALIQALRALNIDFEEIFACDIDEAARNTYELNYGKPKYFPFDVYEREIPVNPLDLYVTSPPCQAFSLSGKRLGENDKRGILFYNSHEFIQVNRPRFFVFENVKGLLSDDKINKKSKYGRTFNRWIDYLGGKSVNGNPVLFPHEKSVPYHIYFKVINSKHLGIPQNRERVFIIGIRDDEDNEFSFPKKMQLNRTMMDIIEKNVDERYFLNDRQMKEILVTGEKQEQILNDETNQYKFARMVGRNPENPKSRKPGLELKQMIEVKNEPISHTITTVQKDNLLVIYSANKKGYEIAEEGDTVTFTFPGSDTRRGRVGKKMAQTLTTSITQGVVLNRRIRRLTPRECFRLMDFPDTFQWKVSESQAYKQAGNSIVVKCFIEILKKLKL